MRGMREYYSYLMLPRRLREELEEMIREVPENTLRPSRKKQENMENLIKLLRDPLALF